MLAIVLLFLSGAAALIYQTLWVKQLTLVVGIDVYAVTTAVAAFFAGLLATYVTGRQGLESYAEDAPAITDDRPRVEHAGWLREGEFPRVLQRVAELRSDPPLMGGMDEEVELARHKLWTLYRAGYFAYTGDVERWESMLKRLVPELRENPYFRWFVTEND